MNHRFPLPLPSGIGGNPPGDHRRVLRAVPLVHLQPQHQHPHRHLDNNSDDVIKPSWGIARPTIAPNSRQQEQEQQQQQQQSSSSSSTNRNDVARPTTLHKRTFINFQNSSAESTSANGDPHLNKDKITTTSTSTMSINSGAGFQNRTQSVEKKGEFIPTSASTSAVPMNAHSNHPHEKQNTRNGGGGVRRSASDVADGNCWSPFASTLITPESKRSTSLERILTFNRGLKSDASANQTGSAGVRNNGLLGGHMECLKSGGNNHSSDGMGNISSCNTSTNCCAAEDNRTHAHPSLSHFTTVTGQRMLQTHTSRWTAFGINVNEYVPAEVSRLRRETRIEESTTAHLTTIASDQRASQRPLHPSAGFRRINPPPWMYEIHTQQNNTSKSTELPTHNPNPIEKEKATLGESHISIDESRHTKISQNHFSATISSISTVSYSNNNNNNNNNSNNNISSKFIAPIDPVVATDTLVSRSPSPVPSPQQNYPHSGGQSRREAYDAFLASSDYTTHLQKRLSASPRVSPDACVAQSAPLPVALSSQHHTIASDQTFHTGGEKHRSYSPEAPSGNTNIKPFATVAVMNPSGESAAAAASSSNELRNISWQLYSLSASVAKAREDQICGSLSHAAKGKKKDGADSEDKGSKDGRSRRTFRGRGYAKTKKRKMNDGSADDSQPTRKRPRSSAASHAIEKSPSPQRNNNNSSNNPLDGGEESGGERENVLKQPRRSCSSSRTAEDPSNPGTSNSLQMDGLEESSANETGTLRTSKRRLPGSNAAQEAGPKRRKSAGASTALIVDAMRNRAAAAAAAASTSPTAAARSTKAKRKNNKNKTDAPKASRTLFSFTAPQSSSSNDGGGGYGYGNTSGEEGGTVPYTALDDVTALLLSLRSDLDDPNRIQAPPLFVCFLTRECESNFSLSEKYLGKNIFVRGVDPAQAHTHVASYVVRWKDDLFLCPSAVGLDLLTRVARDLPGVEIITFNAPALLLPLVSFHHGNFFTNYVSDVRVMAWMLNPALGTEVADYTGIITKFYPYGGSASRFRFSSDTVLGTCERTNLMAMLYRSLYGQLGAKGLLQCFLRQEKRIPLLCCHMKYNGFVVNYTEVEAFKAKCTAIMEQLRQKALHCIPSFLDFNIQSSDHCRQALYDILKLDRYLTDDTPRASSNGRPADGIGVDGNRNSTSRDRSDVDAAAITDGVPECGECTGDAGGDENSGSRRPAARSSISKKSDPPPPPPPPSRQGPVSASFSTKGGKLSTAEDTLRLLSRYHELPRHIMAYRKIAKLINTYAEGLMETAIPQLSSQSTEHGSELFDKRIASHPPSITSSSSSTKERNGGEGSSSGNTSARRVRVTLHPNFIQEGTDTGRFSCVDPNLQNLPRSSHTTLDSLTTPQDCIDGDISIGNFRSCFIAPRRCTLVAIDYQQIELCVLAHLCGDRSLIDALTHSTDIHKAIASIVFQKPSISTEERTIAKRAVFGVLYGAGARTLASQLSIPIERAAHIQGLIRSAFPRIDEYHRKVIENCRREGFIRTLAGRIRPLPEINDTNLAKRAYAERQAFNTVVQGSAADIVKSAMVAVEKDVLRGDSNSTVCSRENGEFLASSPSHGTSPTDVRPTVKLLCHIHDELVFAVPTDQLQEMVGRLQRSMVHCASLIVPLRVSVKVGRSLGNLEEWSVDHELGIRAPSEEPLMTPETQQPQPLHDDAIESNEVVGGTDASLDIPSVPALRDVASSLHTAATFLKPHDTVSLAGDPTSTSIHTGNNDNDNDGKHITHDVDEVEILF